MDKLAKRILISRIQRHLKNPLEYTLYEILGTLEDVVEFLEERVATDEVDILLEKTRKKND